MPGLDSMHFVDLLRYGQARRQSCSALAVLARVSLPVAVALISVACTQQATEQTKGPKTPMQSASAPTSAAQTSGPKWQDLTSAQQRILKPLTSIWNSLDGTSKSKWIAITLNYAARSTAEQQRMQERMAEWATLKPAERERARLNFAETKKLAPTERAADWEAYQGLSAQERNAFAKAGPVKPMGAATAVVPSSPDKLTPVPVTRRTPVSDDATTAVARPNLNPKTLLPAPAVPHETIAVPATEPGAGPEPASDYVAPDRRLTIN